MSYPESVRFLYALGNELKVGAKFGLERMQLLLAGLDHPERALRAIHVAGTNGKGSTCAMLAASCRAAGLRTGLYTSPHLIRPTERIEIDGTAVSESRFADLFRQVHEKAEAMIEAGAIDAHPSYFETVTAMAFLAFRDNTDAAVIEVGLGGRLDATNVISPLVTVITPVDYDHESFLGNTLESIASEKAGILKSGVPLVMAPQAPPAQQVILARAMELSCRVLPVSGEAPANIQLSAYASTFTFRGTQFICPLAGEHQVGNALTAIVAATEFGIPLAKVSQGISQTSWPGRLELIRKRPDFVLDGAHNPAGARALAAYIHKFCRNRPVWLVYGAMRDKAIEEVTSQLFPLAAKLILTTPDFPRALRPEAIERVAGHPNIVKTANVTEAIAVASHAPDDAIVFFTGSLFVVGEARALLLSSSE